MFAAYVQDDYKILPNLTLNLGLRYETHTPWVEVKDRQTNFAPFTGAIQAAGSSSCIYSNCRALYNSYNWGLDFQPRIGFAYNPEMFNRRFVLRGAYTLSSYLEGTGTNLRLPLNPPLNLEYNTTYFNTPLPGSRTGQGLTVLSNPADPFGGAIIRLWDPNVRPAAVNQWNFSTQYQFNNTTTLQVGYIGQRSTHLMVPMPYFQRRLNPDGSTSPSPYLSGNPALSSHRPDLGHGEQRHPELQRAAGGSAQNDQQRSAIPGGLYVLEMHDQFQRLLRIVGWPDHAHIALLAEPL